MVWYRARADLSIHHIDTTRRESFYWLTVLFTFALGTAAGDLVAERMDLGYWLSAVLFALAIAAVAVAHFALGLDAVWSFWIAYILTRPLGASIGDYLSQPTAGGGLGLGTVVTSVLFLAVILGLVVFLTVTRKDVSEPERLTRERTERGPGTAGPWIPGGRLRERVGGVQDAFRLRLGGSGECEVVSRAVRSCPPQDARRCALHQALRTTEGSTLPEPEVLTDMDVAGTDKSVMRKLPEVTLAFWIMKIAATTLGETAGDLFAQTLKLGYFLTTIALFLIFVVTLVVQLTVPPLQPLLLLDRHPVDQHGRHHDVRLHEPRRQRQVPHRRRDVAGLGPAGPGARLPHRRRDPHLDPAGHLRRLEVDRDDVRHPRHRHLPRRGPVLVGDPRVEHPRHLDG